MVIENRSDQPGNTIFFSFQIHKSICLCVTFVANYVRTNVMMMKFLDCELQIRLLLNGCSMYAVFLNRNDSDMLFNRHKWYRIYWEHIDGKALLRRNLIVRTRRLFQKQSGRLWTLWLWSILTEHVTSKMALISRECALAFIVSLKLDIHFVGI